MSDVDEFNLIEARAIKILSIREHSVYELKKKLILKLPDFRTEIIDEVLIELQSKDFLSDERYAEMYVDMRSKKGFGPLRIRGELIERGISRDIIEIELEKLSQDWTTILEKTVFLRFGEYQAGQPRELEKRVRFLNYRGFPESLIRGHLLD
tara:strand:+ start:617 stop:1072 length:456 start_codon:yes stop_codon:yes gene_type:complete